MTGDSIKTMQVLVTFDNGECAIGIIDNTLTKSLVVGTTQFLKLDESKFETLSLKELIKK